MISFDASYEAFITHKYLHDIKKDRECVWCYPPPGVSVERVIHSEPGNPDEPWTMTEKVTLSGR